MTIKNKIKTNSGFTIVEIALVILIIGILASLVIISYRGTQQKASNSQTLSVVSSYVKASKQYYLDNGMFPEPSPGGMAWACLGTGYKNNICLNTVAPACNGFGGVPTSTTWYNDLIKPYMQGKTPPTNLQTVPCAGGLMTGGAYLSNWPVAGQAGIFYQLNGNVNCGKPGGYPAAPWFYADNNSPMCYIVISTD